MAVHFVSGSSAVFGDETILLAVADAKERSTISLALRSVGFKVVEAENGDQAEEKLRSVRFDLVITDLVMPERDGLEVLQTVRHDLPRLPVMVLFAFLDAVQFVVAKSALRLGARAILSKPCETHTLVKEVRRLLTDGH